MLALTLAAPRRFEFMEQDKPAPPGAHEALIRVRAVGVCGTDEPVIVPPFEAPPPPPRSET